MTEKKSFLPQDYSTILAQIRQKIRDAQLEALRSVNSKLITLYWEIGATLIERKESETWRDSAINNLARDLQKTFPGTKRVLKS